MRESVKAFGEAMEQRLQEKDSLNPDGWGYCEIDFLERRMVKQLGDYFGSGGTKELIDIANFAMMVWHRRSRTKLCR